MLSSSTNNQTTWNPILLCGCVLAVILSAGCRYNDPSVDMLENELRWMEDQLYEMEDQLEQTCVDLHRCKKDHQREVATYEARARVQSDGVPVELAPISDPGIEIQSVGVQEGPPSRVILPDGTVYSDSTYVTDPVPMSIESFSEPSAPMESPVELAGPDESYDLPSDLADDTSPVIVSQDDPNPVSKIPERHELPAPVSTPEAEREPTPAGSAPKLEVPERPELDQPEAGSRPSLESDINDDQALRLIPAIPQEQYSVRLQSHVSTERIPTLSSATKRRNVDAHITHIVTQAHRTARSFDGQGHDLEILVQPRNADGNYVSLPANLSVVVIDDELTGDAARVARWDLDASETSRLFRNTDRGEGIHLEFDWPHGDPLGKKLHLYVRYITIDGRKIQAHQFLEPLGESDAATDEGWSVIGRTKPVSEWRVVSQPLVEAVQAVEPIPSAAAPVSEVEKVSAIAPIPVTADESRVVPAAATWELVPADTSNGSSVPGRMPNVKTAPIPLPTSAPTPQAQFSRIPSSVPQWSPRR